MIKNKQQVLTAVWCQHFFAVFFRFAQKIQQKSTEYQAVFDSYGEDFKIPVNDLRRYVMKILRFLLGTIIMLFTVGAKSQEYSMPSEKLMQVLDNINNYYVKDIDDRELADEAILHMMKSLDPHSEYFTKEEAEELMRRLNGSFDGVGLTYSIPEDTIYVISLVANGPSENAGLRRGDRIVRINNENVAGVRITDEQIRDYLLGESGSTVELKIKRRGFNKLLKMTVVRARIHTASISASYLIDENVGFIKLDKFSQNSDTEFVDSLNVLIKRGAEHLILDLRGNTGGYLGACVKITDQFFNRRKLLVYTKGDNSRQSSYESGYSGIFTSGRLVVLTNSHSASASEILAGAVQDLDRGIILGRRTFGKGLVQRPFILNDGSLMRLTIAKYYTASGRCIQKAYDEDRDKYSEELSQRKDCDEKPDSGAVYYTSNNREVYGGGGIYPDICASEDDQKYSEIYRSVLQSGILYDRVYLHSDKRRNIIAGLYGDLYDFSENYTIAASFFKELKEKLPDSISSQLNRTQNLNANDSLHIKALIADNVWGYDSYYRLINENSYTVTKALAVINDETSYADLLHGLLADKVKD